MKIKEPTRKRIPEARITQAADVLRVLAHPARLRMADILDLNGPLAVRDIMEQAGLRQASASEHLNKMRRAGLVKAIRKGREVWYRIEDPRALTLLNCLRKGGQS